MHYFGKSVIYYSLLFTQVCRLAMVLSRAEIRTVVPGVATAIAFDNLGAQLSFMVLELCSYNLTVKQVSSSKVLKTLDLGEPPVAFEESDIVL